MSKKVYKILITEDDTSISSVLGEHLVNEGFDIVIAANGEQGLEMVRSQKPDLIVLDVKMPKMDGLTMLKKLRSTEIGKTLPVIMLTNQKDVEEINEALKYGVHDYFIKADWDMKALLESIRKNLFIE